MVSNSDKTSLVNRECLAVLSVLIICITTVAKTNEHRSEFTAKISLDPNKKVAVEIVHSLGIPPPELLASLKRLILACADREISRNGDGIGELFIEVNWVGRKELNSVVLKNNPQYKSRAVVDCLRSRFNILGPREPKSIPRSMAEAN